jgi:hypothetical protein
MQPPAAHGVTIVISQSELLRFVAPTLCIRSNPRSAYSDKHVGGDTQVAAILYESFPHVNQQTVQEYKWNPTLVI